MAIGTSQVLTMIVILIVLQVLYLLLRDPRSKKKNAILMVGPPGSGKTLLTHGIMTYLQQNDVRYSDDIEGENRQLRQEINEQIMNGEWPTRTNEATANCISFNIKKRGFQIYDFSGESIESQNEITRGSAISNFTNTLKISTGGSSGDRLISFDRRNLKHIIYLIPPSKNGTGRKEIKEKHWVPDNKYSMKSFQSQEKLLKWITELTMRLGGDLEKIYSEKVYKQRNIAKRIKVHAVFTKRSKIHDADDLTEEALTSVLQNFSPELYTLNKVTKGKIFSLNVFTKKEDDIEQDWFGLEELTQALDME